jgi:signal transduction histidine kinase
MSFQNTDQAETPASLLEKATAVARKSLNEALDYINAALVLAEKDNHPEQIDEALAFRAQVHAQLRMYEAGLEDAQRALEGYTQRGNERGRASVLNTLAIIKENAGEYTESFSLQIECLQILRRLAIPEAIAQVASNIGLTCSYIGDWTQALEFYKESLAEWDKLPDQPGKGLLLINLGFAHASLSQYETAESHYREALKVLGDDPLRTCLVHVNLAQTFLERGKLDAAREHARNAWELSQQQEDPVKRGHALHCLGSVQAAIGDTRAARESFDQALKIYSAVPIPRGRAIVLRAIAGLVENEPEAALELLAEARDMAIKSGLKPILIDILGDFNRLHKQQGNWEEAHRFLEEKVQAEKAVNAEISQLKMETLQMDMKLRQSQRETELERLRSTQLSDALMDLEQQKKRAEEENRQKSEILHFAAHDLRNLLNGITGTAELINLDRAEIEHLPHICELVDMMCGAVAKLQHTLQNVLKAAAAESGQVELTREPVALESLLTESVNAWLKAASAKSQSIQRLPGDAALQLSIDRNRIRDCLDNLISNAIKYSPHSATIRTGIEADDQTVSFFVADEGPGLTDEDKRRAGRLFQKLSAQPTGNESSIGVGLAVVKGYAELHGGRMEIESPPEGGSIFRVVLPVDP